MAFIAKVSILIDESDEDSSYEVIQNILIQARARDAEQEDASVIDWNIDAVDPVNASINDSICNDTYANGEAFGDWVIQSGNAASVREGYGYWSKEYGWTSLDLSTKYSGDVQEIPEVCGEGATWVLTPYFRN
jgi:hypothetical protein